MYQTVSYADAAQNEVILALVRALSECDPRFLDRLEAHLHARTSLAETSTEELDMLPHLVWWLIRIERMRAGG